ncbi:MAG: allophanate hydrolase [Gramella sp.]|nr:allophanate hydrolase [Christiangramia sp.]MAM19225.1 allophanate hydrolase [Christiangramia sp.]
MRGEIEVLQPGLFTSLQDRGRFGFQNFGVPRSGVMDLYSMKIGNLILGNQPDAAVLEFTFQGPELKFLNDAQVTLSGGEFMASLDGKAVSRFEVLNIPAGSILKIGPTKNGLRGYMGIKNGFSEEKIMESHSWYEGITQKSRLVKGDFLYFTAVNNEISASHAALKPQMAYLNTDEIVVFAGPEWENVPVELQQEILKQEFTLHQSSNRMAFRVNEKISNALEQIVTGPVIPGTVQFTPGGDLIILGNDCQTTGGYPRILQVSEKGLQVLSQKIPGKKFRFKLEELI